MDIKGLVCSLKANTDWSKSITLMFCFYLFAAPPPPPPPGLSCYVGANFTTHQFTVNAGEVINCS